MQRADTVSYTHLEQYPQLFAVNSGGKDLFLDLAVSDTVEKVQDIQPEHRFAAAVGNGVVPNPHAGPVSGGIGGDGNMEEQDPQHGALDPL